MVERMEASKQSIEQQKSPQLLTISVANSLTQNLDQVS